MRDQEANSSTDIRPSPAAHQNSVCQSTFSAMNADSGSPSAPPTPSEELINPMADPTRSAGTAARSTLIASGMIGMPRPCRPRPTMNGTSELVDAEVTQPTASCRTDDQIGLGPYMSPSRPNTGVATAAVSSVTVIAHEALAGSWCRAVRAARESEGSSGSASATR